MAIDHVRSNSQSSKMFSLDSYCCGKESTGGVYATGYYTKGKELVLPFNEKIRKLLERCERPHGFLINHGLAGGSGSGLTTALINELEEEHHELVIVN